MMSQRVDRERNESARGELQRDEAWRRERVSVAAYYLAQRRGFDAGGEAADWHQAEAETDAADEADADAE
jgi:hypothetical protein